MIFLFQGRILRFHVNLPACLGSLEIRDARTLKLTASLPLKIGILPQKETSLSSNHPFSSAMLVAFREVISSVIKLEF